MARRRGFPLARAPRRKSSWQIGPGSSAVTTFTATSSAFLGSAVVALVDGLTIVRTRGELLLKLRTAASGLDAMIGAFGIAVATEAAVTAGAGSLPTPVVESNWNGWLYHRFFTLNPGGVIDGSAATDHDIVNSTSAALRIEVDSKAMRKFRTEDSLFAMIEVAESGAVTMDAWFDSRFLIKLS